MSIKRTELKAIIKECLIEILTEGVGESLQESIRSPRQSGTMRAISESSPRRQTLNNAMFSGQRPKDPRLDTPIRQQPQIAEAIREVTRDPMMAALFADTANTTLMQQNSAGHGRENAGPPVGMAETYGDMATKVAASATPEQLFGEEVTSKWADAAFGPTRKSSPMQHHNEMDYDPYAADPEIPRA